MYYNLCYELIQVAIGRRGSLSRVPSAEEWSMLYGLALKQAVGGASLGCSSCRRSKRQKGQYLNH